jgi:hypothetical protein
LAVLQLDVRDLVSWYLIARNDDARSTPRAELEQPPSLDLPMLEHAGTHRPF